MFKFKSKTAYWQSYSSYQTFSSIAEMNETVKLFLSVYDLTDAIEAVVNTLKLHSKRFFGVCWLKKEQLAKKAGVSLSTVDRAIKGMKETGFLTVISCNHTKRGGQTHNVYILNPTFDDAPDVVQDVPNEVALEPIRQPVNPAPASDSAPVDNSHKNSHTNSNKTLKDNSIIVEKTEIPDSKEDGLRIDTTIVSNLDILKHVPTEFVEIMEPYYANAPEVILARWKTTCVAIKKYCADLGCDFWDVIRDAWTDVVRMYKRGRVKKATDDGLGGYFYGVLGDYLMDYSIRKAYSVMTAR